MTTSSANMRKRMSIKNNEDARAHAIIRYSHDTLWSQSSDSQNCDHSKGGENLLPTVSTSPHVLGAHPPPALATPCHTPHQVWCQTVVAPELFMRKYVHNVYIFPRE